MTTNTTFKAPKGTVGYVLALNKDVVDGIATQTKAQAILTLRDLFKNNEENLSRVYADQVLQNASKKRSANEILIYLYNILLAQQNMKAIK